MGWVHGSRMTQTYVHLSGRDQDNAILKTYGIEVKEERPIESQKPSLCPRYKETNYTKAKFCWKCCMILDRSLTEKKLKEEAREIETAIMKFDLVDTSTKRIVETFPDDFKDLILETVLKQIADNSELKEKFQRKLIGGRSKWTGRDLSIVSRGYYLGFTSLITLYSQTFYIVKMLDISSD
jgi:integrase/recombinase XerD